MIEFNYESKFTIDNADIYQLWLLKVIASEQKVCGELSFIFCDDAYLLELNIKHLQHDTLTDIITFDYCLGDELSGDIFISIERVAENAVSFGVSFDNELRRVMAHGVLHLCGFSDKSAAQTAVMRVKEEEKIVLF